MKEIYSMFQLFEIFCEERLSDSEFEEISVLTKPKESIKEPLLVKVLLHNDDYTPMDFVVEILENFFNKQKEEAHDIMLEVHNKGVGIGGVYPKEIAETKADLIHKYAHECDYPLKCTLEEHS